MNKLVFKKTDTETEFIRIQGTILSLSIYKAKDVKDNWYEGHTCCCKVELQEGIVVDAIYKYGEHDDFIPGYSGLLAFYQSEGEMLWIEEGIKKDDPKPLPPSSSFEIETTTRRIIQVT